jgi:hypothetical protein
MSNRSHLRPIITPYNENELYLAETLICDRFNRCETYYMPLIKKPNKNPNKNPNKKANKMNTLATIPPPDSIQVRPSKFDLNFSMAVTNDYFSFSGPSDVNFTNSGLWLSVRRSGNYLISVAFPWGSPTLPEQNDLQTKYAELYVDSVDVATLNEWSWVTNDNYGMMSMTIPQVFNFSINQTIGLYNLRIAKTVYGSPYINLIPAPQTKPQIQTKATPYVIGPWTVNQKDSDGTKCSDPTEFVKSYPTNYFTYGDTSGIYVPYSFIYSPNVTYSQTNNLPIAGFSCQQDGTYTIQLNFTTAVTFSYTGTMYYSSAGNLYNEQWTVSAGQTQGIFNLTRNGNFTVNMNHGDYIYLDGYCTHTKITGQLIITTN